MGARLVVQVEVGRLTEFEMSEECPKGLVEMILWLQRKLQSVPREYRAAAGYEIRTMDDEAMLTVFYHRPETDEEMRERLARWEKQDEDDEFAEYQRLKKKFEDRHA